MYNNYDYPVGADNQNAPWNQPLCDLYDWACGDYKPNLLDRYDER